MSSSPPNETWKDETLAKVIKITENQEALARVLWYLTEEDKKYKESGQVSPTWRTLKYVLRKDTAFKLFVDQIAETTKQPNIDTNFRETWKDEILVKVIRKQTNLQLGQLFASPSRNTETLNRELPFGLAACSVNALSRCFVSAMLLILSSLAVISG